MIANRTLIYIGVGVGLVAAVAIVIGAVKGKKIVGEVANAVNPFNDENIFYEGANAAGAAITGEKEFSLGAWIWEKTHPGQVEQEKRITYGTGPVWVM